MNIQEIKEAVKNNLDSQVQSLLLQSIDEAKTLIIKKISEEVKEISELNAKYKEIVVNNTDIKLKEAEKVSSSFKKLSLIFGASVLEKLEMYERVQKNSDQLSLQLTKISINNSAGLYCMIRAEQSQYIVNKLGENLDSWISNHNPSLKDPENEKGTMVLLFKTWQKTIDTTIDKLKENYTSLSILNKQITAKKNLNQEDLSTMEIPKEYLFIKSMDLTATQDVNKIKNLREDKTGSSLNTEVNKYIKLLEETANNNGKLLSKEWNGSFSKYEFELSDGTNFSTTAHQIFQRGWPQRINRFGEKNEESLLNKLNSLANQYGGKLISEKWLGSLKKHDFEDVNGERFSITPKALQSGQWRPVDFLSESICNQCLEHLFKQKFSKTRNILNAELLNRKNSLELDGYCEELKIAFEYQGHPGHWDKKYKGYTAVNARDKIKKGYCKINYKEINYVKKDTTTYLNNLLNIAQENKGKLLSCEWKGSKAKYQFEFQDGNKFEMTYDNILNTGWPKDAQSYLKRIKNYKKIL